MAGPLAGLRVVEMAGIGPAPFAAMVLADLGADVVRITRPKVAVDPLDLTTRSRRSLDLDLRRPEAVAAHVGYRSPSWMTSRNVTERRVSIAYRQRK